MNKQPKTGPLKPLWHSLPENEVYAALKSKRVGLTQAEAKQRICQFGSNRLSMVSGKSVWRRLLSQFQNVLIYVLVAAALTTWALGDWVDSLVIFCVVLINAVIGYIQEGKAEKALLSISKILTVQATVYRNQKKASIPAEQLVPGDIVYLESGDKVPADLRLLTTKSLRLDESMLTGESVSVEKTNNPVTSQANLAERACMAYSGTLVSYGAAIGIVVATGDATELGKINRLLKSAESLVTPLLRQIAEFSRWLTIVILAVASLTLAYGWYFRHSSLPELFMSVVGLAVAAIPEGLPAIMTITLAIGVQKMARQNAIIRRLPAVETLGAVTVICTDKTGTLTCNEMMVESVVVADKTFTVDGSGYDPAKGGIWDGITKVILNHQPVLRLLINALTLCNNASIVKKAGNWSIQGDPTEAALITLALKSGAHVDTLKQFFPRLDDIPFESVYSFMATLHRNKQGSVVILKGAPEQVIAKCGFQLHSHSITDINRRFWYSQSETLAARGQRVLAVAIKWLPMEQPFLEFADVEANLVLLGIVGMADPPRPEALQAVRRCQQAGIVVKMITGDHSITALAIAKQMAIGNGVVLKGEDLDGLSDTQLVKTAEEVDIYARVSPENKLRLVQALANNGHIVAMTGDGVNDAPALKSADIGIAMGKKGTEVAKEASEMVLADDNFATIAKAVETGRGIYDNLKKAILFILPTSGAEALMIVVAILSGNVLPITPLQILWINMVTEISLSLTLAFEPPEPNLMQRKPRAADAPLLSGFLVWRIIIVSVIMLTGTYGLFLWELSLSGSVSTARTIAVNTLVMYEIYYLFNSRYTFESVLNYKGLFGNKLIWLAIGGLIVAQGALTYWPPMQALFGTVYLPWAAWLKILIVPLGLFIIIEIEKAFFRAAHQRKKRNI